MLVGVKNPSLKIFTYAMAGNRTRINCLEGSYADHYTTIAVLNTFGLNEISALLCW